MAQESGAAPDHVTLALARLEGVLVSALRDDVRHPVDVILRYLRSHPTVKKGLHTPQIP